MQLRLLYIIVLSITLLVNNVFSMQQPIKTDSSITHNSAADKELLNVPFFDNPDNMLGQPLIKKNHDDRVIIQQVKVLDQNGMSYITGENSCGYHSAKNVCALLGLLHGFPSTANYLRGAEQAFGLFAMNGHGVWRNTIIALRKKHALREILLDRLLHAPVNTLPNENVAEMRNQYLLLLKKFLDEQIALVERDHCIVEVNEQMLTNYITHTEILNRFPGDSENISRYINLAAFTISLGDILDVQIPEKYIQAIGSADGELLEPDEIKIIFSEVKKNSEDALARYMGDCTVAIYPSTAITKKDPEHLESEPINPLEIEGVLPTLHDSITNHRMPEKRIYAFVLGGADQADRKPGRWVALILEIANGIRRYTIADSLNGDHKLQGPATNVIEYLEGGLENFLPLSTDRNSQQEYKSDSCIPPVLSDLEQLRNFNPQDPNSGQLLGRALLAILKIAEEEGLLLPYHAKSGEGLRCIPRTYIPNSQSIINILNGEQARSITKCNI